MSGKNKSVRCGRCGVWRNVNLPCGLCSTGNVDLAQFLRMAAIVAVCLGVAGGLFAAVMFW